MNVTDAPSGILPVDKPTGPTSHDLVASARRALGTRRVGHAGTLDPFASGLLLLLVGGGTRLAEYLSPLPKSYVATARLGIRTTTHDPEGEVVERSDGWKALATESIREALDAFRGEVRQLPPRYSAKKVGGRPAHRRVRAGEEVTLAPATVTIHEVALEEVRLPELRFRVTCSTGTYIRAMARDLGEALGVGAYLTDLRRTRIGPFSVEEALPAHRLEEDPGAARAALHPPLLALPHLPRIELDADEAARVAMGQAVPVPGTGDGGEEVRVEWHDDPSGRGSGPVALAREGELVAVGEVSEGRIRPRKVFRHPEG